MQQTKKPSRLLSFFGAVAAGDSEGGFSKAGDPPELSLETDREVYRPGDLVNINLEIRNTNQSSSLLIRKLSFEIRGVEKLDTTWFNIPKASPESKQRRGEFVFMECSLHTLVSNKIVAAGASKKYIFRTFLPSIIPPSYRGATIRYLYYVKSTLSGQYLLSDNGHCHNESTQDLPALEARIPLQIWVTQKNNGLLSEEGQSDGIVPGATIYLEAYWKEMGEDSEWVRANENFDGIEEGYESSRDEISSVSSYNPGKSELHKAFGSSLSLQSTIVRSAGRDLSYVEGRNSVSSHLALPRLSVAEVSDSGGGNISPSKSSASASPSQRLSHTRSLSLSDEGRVPPSPGTVESGASEGFIRGRSYNIRLDDQVLLRFSPKNSDSTYYFSDVIGGTLTFFHEEAARRCLELSVTLEMNETIIRRFVHPSRRHSPMMTKVLTDHHQVVADLLQTSFLFSIPMDGPMSFSTRYISVQWVLRFEFLTTPKNVDWTRLEHPLLVTGRDKFEWLLPITVHAPPGAGVTQIQNEKSVSMESLWGQS